MPDKVKKNAKKSGNQEKKNPKHHKKELNMDQLDKVSGGRGGRSTVVDTNAHAESP